MLTRTATVGSVAAAVIIASAVPALASGWGSVDCGSDPSPYCDLNAGRDGQTAPIPGAGGEAESVPDSPAVPEDEPESEGDRILDGDGGADCSYVRSDYQPPGNGVRTIAAHPPQMESGGVQFVAVSSSHAATRVGAAQQAPGQAGAWYVYRCSGQGSRDALFRAPVWIADERAPEAARVPSPEELAQRARSQLRLPDPQLGFSPAGTQLVRVPTWLWLAGQSWGARSSTASVPGISVTARASPRSVSWSMGDGTTLRCDGPGTRFPPEGDPAAESPDCGHVYHQSSASQTGQRFPVTATVSWEITWSGAGASGSFPGVTTSASSALRVAETQALGTG